MPISRQKIRSLMQSTGKFATVAILLCSLCGNMLAQEMGDFQTPRSHWPNPLAPYKARETQPPSVVNTPRLEQLIKDGKLLLSLDDAIAIGLENNLDLAIARYNLPIADTDIMRTKSGQSFLGVPLGLVSGTIGGSALQAPGASGGGAGGTTTGVGGAGAGAGGLTGSTLGAGPQVEQLDPAITGTLELEHSTAQVTSAFSGAATGSPTLGTNTFTGNLGYTQGFITGTNVSVTFNNNRVATDNDFNILNPTLNSNFKFQVQQHLLQGFGIKNQNRYMRIARNNKRASESAFRAQVIYTVSQIENIYWNLVSAYQDVQAKQRSVELSQKLAGDNRKQVQIGTLAPIEIVRADSQVASSNQALIISKTNLQLQQLEMLNAISRNIAKSKIAGVEVIPTDTVQLEPTAEDNQPVESLIDLALAQSPSLEQQNLDLDNRDISRKSARNALLPTLDLNAFYATSSVGGLANPAFTSFPGAPTPTVTVPGDYGGVFTNLFNNTAPDKAAYITLNIPLRNRAAQSTQARSELEYRQAELLLQQIQNTLSIQVRNSAFAVQQNRASYEAAIEARRLAQESLDAEQKKYALGASTTYNVLTMINNLSSSDANLVTALAAYAQSRVTLDQVTASTLKRLNISLGDTIEAQVHTMPTVPGVVPANQTPTPAPAETK